MSGITGILNLDGSPVDGMLVRSMTDSLAFRGPDAQCTWVDGQVGFGHAMLRSTFEAERESQPFTLDGRVWIVADARIDGRTQLLAKLGHHVHGEFPTEPELILRAYEAWGIRCVEHLLGDFAFAIWDAGNRRLFCARDHFGIKPFFYALRGAQFVFSNTLDTLLLHPSVRHQLDDAFIADFLAIGSCTDPAASVYQDIRRLPAAHTLSCSNGSVVAGRYWELPSEPANVRYKNDADLLAHFRDTLSLAVEDRLRTKSAAVYMSGGMDSSSVAALARQSMAPSAELRAYTVVYDRLIPDEERHYAGIVATHLNIPIEFLAADDYQLFERWHSAVIQPIEPVQDPLLAVRADLVSRAANAHRVVLDGNGGDPVLYGTSVLDLTARCGPLRMLWLLRHVARRRRDRPELGLRRWWRRRRHHPIPPWLNPDLVSRTHLAARLESAVAPLPSTHTTHPEAYSILASSFWAALAEASDPGVTRRTIESRYPFLDLRLIAMVFNIPPWPWCGNKQVLRESMEGGLPRSIVGRPKSPMLGDPVRVLVLQNQHPIAQERNLQEIGDYIDVDRARSALKASTDCWSTMGVLCLSEWIQLSK